MDHVINHDPSKLLHPTREDGGLRDPDPRRRAARLDSHGIEIRRNGVLRYDVRRGDRHLGTRRTFGGAEMLAHTHAGPQVVQRRDDRLRGDDVAGWHLRTAR